MKFLLVSDLHYVLKHFDWVLSIASQFDAVVIAGDQIDGRSHVYMRVQIPVILKYMERLQAQTQLLVCSGNHDVNVRGGDGERIARWLEPARNSGIITDGNSFEKNGTLFTVCPWWDGPKTREHISEQLAADAEKTRQSWIWVYHGPPDNSPTSWTGKRHYGDAGLVTLIEQFQPDIVLTGHIHEAPFVDDGSWVDQIGATWIFNSGRERSPYPPHIVISVEKQTAIWCSQENTELVRLNQPLQRPPVAVTEIPGWLENTTN
jgi:Icc-related predicted phosphoesterase